MREVQTVAPDAGGSAVTIVATSRTIIDAFRDAAIGAVVAIAVILFVALAPAAGCRDWCWRRCCCRRC